MNLFQRANSDQICCLIDKNGLLESLNHIITNLVDMKQEVLDAVLNVLQTENSDSGTNYKKKIKEAGLIEIIEELANDDELSSDANQILEYFMPVEQEINQENCDETVEEK